MQQRGTKRRTEVTSVKTNNLFIRKEDEGQKIPPNAAAVLSILFLLACKPWIIQSMTMWSQ